MRFRLLFRIARTHLLSRMKQTVVAALGVTFGIAMFILMISFMTGMNNLLEDIAMESTPHIRLYNESVVAEHPIVQEVYPENMTVLHNPRPKEKPDKIHNGTQIVRILKQDPRVFGVSPLLSTQVFYNYGATQLPGVVFGVDINEEHKLFNIGSKMIEGTLGNLLTNKDALLMGSGLAKKLDLKLGDVVTVTTPKGLRLNLKVVGIFKTGVQQIDETRSYSTLSTAQKLMKVDAGYITAINLKLLDRSQATGMAPVLARQFDVSAEDWETANATILVSFRIRSIMTYVIVVTLLVVAGFGIYNIMNMTIYEKIRDIAILKATGFNGPDVVGVFLMEAMLIGMLGALIGLVLGFGLSYALSLVPFKIEAFVSINSLPVTFFARHYIMGGVFGFVTAAAAGYFPSRRAAKVDPVEIIRGK